MHIGPEDNPGGMEKSPNWPFVAPGVWGPANALSPKYAGQVRKLYAIKRESPWLLAVDEAYVLVSIGGVLPREERPNPHASVGSA